MNKPFIAAKDLFFSWGAEDNFLQFFISKSEGTVSLEQSKGQETIYIYDFSLIKNTNFWIFKKSCCLENGFAKIPVKERVEIAGTSRKNSICFLIKKIMQKFEQYESDPFVKMALISVLKKELNKINF
jgi:hypothetical protein